MKSELILVDVHDLQQETIEKMQAINEKVGIYICLNRSRQSTEKSLKDAGIDVTKIFFIDCVSADKIREDVLHIQPRFLGPLYEAIEEFVDNIAEEKFLIIDALSTLLIYNDDQKVANFVKKIIDRSAKDKLHFISFTPKTKGEELLSKIFGYFDFVENK